MSNYGYYDAINTPTSDASKGLCMDGICDYNYLRHVGWQESNDCIKKLYSPETIALISKKVTELTRGVDIKNRKILVPNSTICSVIDGVYQGFRPPTGDIFTRYIIPNTEQADMVQSIIDQTIEVITNNIRGQMGMEQANQKLSAWVQVYGDFNAHNLRQYTTITTRDKKPMTMMFNMNY